MRQLLKDTCETARAIMDGELDENLDWIVQAAQARKKNLFRPGMVFKLVGTKNVELDGKLATVLKVNAKRITVGLGEVTHDQWGTTWSDGEFNVPPSMLQAP